MTAFFQSVIDFFSTVGAFLKNLVQSLVYLVKLLPKALFFVNQVMGFVPSFVLAFLLAGVTISLVFMIVGRNGS